MVHVIDDFLFLAESSAKCAADTNAFIKLCEQTTLPFLGIILDTLRLEARLPEDKLTKCKSLLREFLSRQKVMLKKLQSLTGVLNFACFVIVPGRAFLRRLIDLIIGVTRPHRHIRLTQQVKLDLRVWQICFLNFNGRAFFLDDDFHAGDCLQLYTDAPGSIEYGTVYGKECFFGSWPSSWYSLNISVL